MGPMGFVSPVEDLYNLQASCATTYTSPTSSHLLINSYLDTMPTLGLDTNPRDLSLHHQSLEMAVPTLLPQQLPQPSSLFGPPNLPAGCMHYSTVPAGCMHYSTVPAAQLANMDGSTMLHRSLQIQACNAATSMVQIQDYRKQPYNLSPVRATVHYPAFKPDEISMASKCAEVSVEIGNPAGDSQHKRTCGYSNPVEDQNFAACKLQHGVDVGLELLRLQAHLGLIQDPGFTEDLFCGHKSLPALQAGDPGGAGNNSNVNQFQDPQLQYTIKHCVIAKNALMGSELMHSNHIRKAAPTALGNADPLANKAGDMPCIGEGHLDQLMAMTRCRSPMNLHAVHVEDDNDPALKNNASAPQLVFGSKQGFRQCKTSVESDKSYCSEAAQVRYGTLRVAPRRPTAVKKKSQSKAAANRRRRIGERFKTLRALVPGGAKIGVDLAAMLELAAKYVRFLQAQQLVLLNEYEIESACAGNYNMQSLCHGTNIHHTPLDGTAVDDHYYEMQHCYSNGWGAVDLAHRLVLSERVQERLSQAGACVVTKQQASLLNYSPHTLVRSSRRH